MAVDIETCLELGKVHTAVGPENNIILFRIASALEEVEKDMAGLVIYVASIRAATEMNTPQVRGKSVYLTVPSQKSDFFILTL
jgi:hypothetical protein